MVFWLSLIMAIASVAVVWSGHFESSFHLDDSHVIVSNRAIRSVSNIGSFFKSPQTFSSRSDHSAYEPLLSASFALDYKMIGRADPLFFQVETFLWFLIELILLYGLFRLIPGGGHWLACFGAFLCGLHPLAAETVNYASQRGMIYSAIGVIAGLTTWIAWPRRMPSDFLLPAPRVPKNDWDMFRIRLRPHLSKIYRRMLGLPLPFYLVPVILGMLAGPAAVVFAPLLLAYILIFEPGRVRQAIPAFVVCGGVWILQFAVIWNSAARSRPPVLPYLATQPWVTLRYLYAFVVPAGFTAETSLQPFGTLWNPLALAGYAGLAALLWLAVRTARRAELRGVSFGLWWFLIALLPGAILPQRDVEAYPRMFLAYAGLALALTRAAGILLERLERREGTRSLLPVGAPAIAVLVLAACGFQTYNRNEVWRSDQDLWADVIEKHPRDGRALMNYGLTFMNSGTPDLFGARYSIGFDYLTKAATLLSRDPQLETELGIANEQMSRDNEAEDHFRRAIAFMPPPYSPAYSAYSAWLLSHRRSADAFIMATKALQADPQDLIAPRVLADLYIERNDWPNALQVARRALEIDPGDQEALRSLKVAGAGVAALSNAVQVAAAAPTVDHYLALSVVYFQDARYTDSIQASRQALKLQPDLAEAYANMAAANHAMGRIDEGIANLREALRLRPDLQVVKNNLEYELAHNSSVKNQ